MPDEELVAPFPAAEVTCTLLQKIRWHLVVGIIESEWFFYGGKMLSRLGQIRFEGFVLDTCTVKDALPRLKREILWSS
ncbi:hypothetical protein F441_17164 [Phytophthora nicotianae CJ01A1]|uniref:Uncharacterized protein n=1 Tax=Phytophthora nicotianae CJ01A1 TaxID=1317063 RepID=W2W7K2_PHYNI|nr:hypothetical protein F441_17164 [Phytophthora nicotianae CJ01A1]